MIQDEHASDAASTKILVKKIWNPKEMSVLAFFSSGLQAAFSNGLFMFIRPLKLSLADFLPQMHSLLILAGSWLIFRDRHAAQGEPVKHCICQIQSACF